LLPASFERFPEHAGAVDPKRDTEINLGALGVDYVHFRISILGEVMSPAGGSFAVPPSILNARPTSVDTLFEGGIDWFFLPLSSSTILFVVHAYFE
jgi:hypothetical protein